MQRPESSSNVEQFFDEAAVSFTSRYTSSPGFQERYCLWKGLIEKYCEKSPGGLCLDVGCGDGLLGRVAAKKGYDVTGFDQSSKMLALAEKKAAAARLSRAVEYIKASLPFSAELLSRFSHRADLIVCSSVLEYVDDYLEVLNQFAEMLKPGGILLLSLPNAYSIYRGFERVVRRTPFARLTYLQHQRHQFRVLQASEAFAECNFRLLELHYLVLPFQRYTRFIFANRRPPWMATLFLMAGEKKTEAEN